MSTENDLTQLQTSLERLTGALERNAADLARTRRQLHITVVTLSLAIGIALFAGLRGPALVHADSGLATLEQEKESSIKTKEAEAKAHFDHLIDQIRIDAQKTGKIDPAGAIAVFLRDMRDALASMPKMAKDMDSMSRDMSEMNGKMSAVPVMASEMQHMNVLMGVMAHGVDSTMGRMGNWMPWAP